ncbi:hypothetical protein [Mycolicibacterium phlei]
MAVGSSSAGSAGCNCSVEERLCTTVLVGTVRSARSVAASTAPPELRKFIFGTDGVRGLPGCDAAPDRELPSPSAGESALAEGVAPEVFSVLDGLESDASEFDDELDELDESESSSAQAVPAPKPVATAAPTPSATARTPMRPM